MDKKLAYAIMAMGITVASATVFAAAEASAKMDDESIIKRLEALEDANKKSGWTEKVKVKGDFRYRYEYKAKDGNTDKNRHRIRARIGAYADVNDQVKAGIRLASGSDESPTSTNQTIDDYSSKKRIWLDLAYLTYSPDAINGLSVALGKMKQPWEQVSDLIFDTDVNPEGIGTAYEIDLDALTLATVLGYHIMAENKGDDVELLSAQIAASGKVAEDIKLTAGVGAFIYNNIEGTAPPTSGNNTTNAVGGMYTYGYEIIDGFAKLDIKKGPAPVKIYGEYLNNMASGVGEDTAWLVGVGAKYKKFGLDYNYRDMEADSVLGVLADGDFGGPGGKGHKINAKYALLKNWSAALTYFRVKNSGVDIDLLQANLVVKF